MSANLNDFLASMKPKSKAPNSIRVLSKWIDLAENQLSDEKGGRLSWLVASSVVIAKLQQVLDETGTTRFILKGGTFLQYRLNIASRATKDVDGIARGDIDEFIDKLDEILGESWGAIEFSRSEVEEIKVPSKLVNPRRIEISLSIKGKVWRRIKVEISPDEGLAGTVAEEFKPPPLSGLGLPSVDSMVGIALSYQIAQKIHAATDPHDPPEFVNNRARDVVDLLLLKDFADEHGEPEISDIADAVVDIFAARADEAKQLGRQARSLPCKVIAWDHWAIDYENAASSCGMGLTLDEAVNKVNDWIDEILYRDNR